MIKPLLRSLLLIGLCSTLATADWPERYGLRSADGKRAELRLAAESENVGQQIVRHIGEPGVIHRQGGRDLRAHSLFDALA